jgi:hypothetical protein
VKEKYVVAKEGRQFEFFVVGGRQFEFFSYNLIGQKYFIDTHLCV